MATTGPRVVKAALAVLLEAKGALSGVTIYTYTVTDESRNTREYLILGNVEGTAEPNTMGGSVLSDYVISCQFAVNQPTVDGTADRGWAILDAVAEVLASDWTISGNVLDADLETFELNETVDADGGRRVDVEFTIRIRDLNA